MECRDTRIISLVMKITEQTPDIYGKYSLHIKVKRLGAIDGGDLTICVHISVAANCINCDHITMDRKVFHVNTPTA